MLGDPEIIPGEPELIPGEPDALLSSAMSVSIEAVLISSATEVSLSEDFSLLNIDLVEDVREAEFTWLFIVDSEDSDASASKRQNFTENVFQNISSIYSTILWTCWEFHSIQTLKIFLKQLNSIST